jgi:hypothetical protein
LFRVSPAFAVSRRNKLVILIDLKGSNMTFASIVKSAIMASAMAAGVMSTQASAATIILNDIGGVTPGTKAYQGFRTAANYWASQLTNDVTIRLNVGFNVLPPNVLGSTGSRFVAAATEDVYAGLAANSSSALDAVAVANLSPLQPTGFGVGGVNMYTPGYLDEVNKLGVDPTKTVFDTDGTLNNVLTGMTRANAKALGLIGDNGTRDATIQFSSQFAFDFDATDGISPFRIDFLGVAIHEIGHALGFVSGVDDYDFLGGNPDVVCLADGTLCRDYPVNDDWFGETLDLFRYSNQSNGDLDWRTGASGATAFFSIDGNNPYNGALFSTGDFTGDGNQASHWKDNQYFPGRPGCAIAGPSIGIMDPTFARCQQGIVTSTDLAAFDAIGWNVKIDALNNPFYGISTGQIFATFGKGLPEPGTWAQMLLGFSLVGGAMRRRVTKVSYAI